MSVNFGEIKEFLQQPAPRSVPARIRKLVLSTTGLNVRLLAGAGLLGFGLLVSLLFFPRKLVGELLLDHSEYRQAEARVTDLVTSRLSVNKRSVHRATYEFTVDQRKHNGSSYHTKDLPTPNGHRTVHYLASDPTVNRLAGGSLNPVGYLGALMGLFPLVGLVILFGALRNRHHRLRILRVGKFALAHVRSIDATNVRINNQLRFRITIQLESPEVPEPLELYRHGPEVDLARRSLESSEPTGVLYDPARPSRLIILESLLGQ